RPRKPRGPAQRALVVDLPAPCSCRRHSRRRSPARQAVRGRIGCGKFSFSNSCSAANVMTVRAVDTFFPGRSLHAGQPNTCQRVGDFFRIKLLVLLAAEELLDQEVIGHHAQKTTRRHQGISLAKNAEPHAPANVAGESLVVVGDEAAKEACGELMVFKRREPEQAGELAVPRRSRQDLARNSLEDFEVCPACIQQPLDALAASPWLAYLLDHGPITVLFAGEMAEQQCLVDAGFLGDLARRRALIALPGKQSERNFQNLLAPVFSC